MAVTFFRFEDLFDNGRNFTGENIKKMDDLLASIEGSSSCNFESDVSADSSFEIEKKISPFGVKKSPSVVFKKKEGALGQISGLLASFMSHKTILDQENELCVQACRKLRELQKNGLLSSKEYVKCTMVFGDTKGAQKACMFIKEEDDEAAVEIVKLWSEERMSLGRS